VHCLLASLAGDAVNKHRSNCVRMQYLRHRDRNVLAFVCSASSALRSVTANLTCSDCTARSCLHVAVCAKVPAETETCS
jgi:hypothetical protein